MNILFILCIAILVIIILFAFPQFSPIPYFPSNGKDIPLILNTLHIQNNQTIIDLGAGDGIIIFKAADKAYQDKLNTKFIAVEINPVLLFILHIRRIFHPNKHNIQILNTNMFTINYSRYALHVSRFTFYLYISPWFIEKTVVNIEKQIKEFDLVSYFYQVKCLPKYKEEIKVGVHKVFKYTE